MNPKPKMLIVGCESNWKDVEVMYISYVNRAIKIRQINSEMFLKGQC